MTVRRDIELLAREGCVERVHGGALAGRRPQHRRAGVHGEVVADDRRRSRPSPQAAAGWSSPGASIGISAGTTTYELARALRDVPDLTVVTNSVPVAQLLHESGTPGQMVVLTGGRAHALGRPGRPGGGRARCARCTSTGCSSACTASTRDAGPDHTQPRRGRDQPRPGRRRPAGAACSPTTPSGASSGSRTIVALSTRSTCSSPTRASTRPAPCRGAVDPRAQAGRPSSSSRGRARGAPPGQRRGGASDHDRDRAPHRRDALADGREIIYFDDTARTSGAHPRRPPTPAPLGERAARRRSMRYDALTGDWVAIAGHRLNRTFLPPADECPLCPTGRGHRALRDPRRRLRRRGLREPLPLLLHPAPSDGAGDGEPLWPSTCRRHGRCEVVCFTSDHDASVRRP